MMPAKTKERMLTIMEARQRFSTHYSRTPSRSVVYKWTNKGSKNRRTNQICKLRSWPEGGRLMVPESAITEFIDARNAGYTDL